MDKEKTKPDNLSSHFSLEKSGATLSWDFFSSDLFQEWLKGTTLDGNIQEKLQQLSEKPLVDVADTTRFSKLFSYVEDNDIWRYALPDSKAFSAGLAYILKDEEFDVSVNPSLFGKLEALDPQEVIETGKKVLEENDRLVEEEVEKAFVFRIMYTLPPVEESKSSSSSPTKPEFADPVNCNASFECLGVLTKLSYIRSSLGNALAKKSQSLKLAPVGLVAYEEKDAANADAVYKVELRVEFCCVFLFFFPPHHL